MSAEVKKKPSSLHRKGVFLHCSSVYVSGKAILFLGHSNAGKSTISQLLSERYPVIADDKVWISRKSNGDWMVRDASSNFRGVIENYFTFGRDQYPLIAVLRIFKSNATQILPISPKETCVYLLDAVFEIDFQRRIDDVKIRKEWFKLAAQISRKIEGWHLTFPKDKSIINEIHNNFDEKKKFAWRVNERNQI